MPTIIPRTLYAAMQLPLLVALGASVLFLILLQMRPIRRPLARAIRRHGALVLVTASALTVGVYAAVLGWYLTLPNFAGEVEPTVTSISWLASRGAPLYHGMEAASRYSVLYGPAIFLINGWLMQLLGPSAASAKLAGVLAGASSMVFLYLAIRTVLSHRMTLFLCAIAVFLCFIHGPFSYLSRPDPLLLTATSFALLCAVQRSKWLGTLGLAAATAWSIDMKIHGFIYLLVPFAIHLRRHGMRHTLGAAGLGGILALAPFVLLPNVSLSNYALWLREAARHGLDGATFQKTLRFALFMLLPLGLASRQGSNSERLPLAALAASYVTVLFFASKPGAGLNHLLPLIPPTLFMIACMMRSEGLASLEACARLGRVRQAAVMGVLFTTLFLGVVAEAKCMQRLHRSAQRGESVLSDLRTVVRQHPELTIAMAYGGEGVEYELTFYRPHLLFAGQPLLVDIIACMESQRSRRPLSAETYEALQSGAVQLWLVPKGGKPFRKKNWYPPHQNVFPPDFVDILLERYRRRESSEYFDLWFYEEQIDVEPAAASAAPARS